MKKISTETINGITKTGYFLSQNPRSINEVRFEKNCYTKDGDKLITHKLVLYFKKLNEENIMYTVEIAISSDTYKTKKFKLFSVPRFESFKYLDENLQEKKKLYLSTESTLTEVWMNPIVSRYFRDFVNMYASSKEHPINIKTIYMKRLYIPQTDFEKLLFSSDSKFTNNYNENHSIISNIRLAARLDYKKLKNNQKER